MVVEKRKYICMCMIGAKEKDVRNVTTTKDKAQTVFYNFVTQILTPKKKRKRKRSARRESR